MRTTVVRFGTGELRYRLDCQKPNIVKNIIIWVGCGFAAHVPAALSCCLSLLSGSGLDGADAARQRLVAMTPGCVGPAHVGSDAARRQCAGSAQAQSHFPFLQRAIQTLCSEFSGMCNNLHTDDSELWSMYLYTNPQILSVSDNVNHWAHHSGRLSQGERHSISSRPEIVQIYSNTRPAEIVLDIELEVSSIHFQFTTVTTTPTCS